MRPPTIAPSLVVLLLASLSLPAGARGEETDWIELSGTPDFGAWEDPSPLWTTGGDAHIDPADPKRLAADPGSGVIISGIKAKTPNLTSKRDFGDVEFHCEFMVPKGSNSGMKLQAVYEIQIFDSYGTDKPLDGASCGGIYPRAEPKPKYHHIDDGYPPRTNASKPPGEWQTLDVIFQAPRVDGDGKKTADARFVKVVLNGELIHDDVVVPCPTGNNWTKPARPTGPILLQGDHGPVAFRNVRARDWKGKTGSPR